MYGKIDVQLIIAIKLKLKNKDKFIQKLTGLVLDPYFSATKINWILKNAPKKNIKQLKIFYLEQLILGYYGNLLKVDHTLLILQMPQEQ